MLIYWNFELNFNLDLLSMIKDKPRYIKTTKALNFNGKQEAKG